MVASSPAKKAAASAAKNADPALEEVKETFSSLCRDINMDSATGDAAWTSYEHLRLNYMLEGNQLHWLACALYVACHNSSVVEGNGLSLTRLLRSCKLSLIQFFNKSKKWADMCNLKKEFRDKIDSLERNFAVSNVIFKKYQPIFVYLFKDPAKDPAKPVRSRKQKKPPCTPSDVFDFCWGLFVRVKTDFPAISDDLVNSYHLLLSCIDYVYGSAVLDKRDDLINMSFDGVKAASENNEDEDTNAPPCILDSLCRVHDGIINEVKSIREHCWKPHIKKFFEQRLLQGDEEDTQSGLLDPANFDANARNIRKDYEAYVLGIGEYDERVFLGEDANEEIGTPTKITSASSNPTAPTAELNERMYARRNLATQFDGSSLIPTTPLSGKHYLKAKEQLKITPVSTATYLVSRLNALIGKREPEAGPKLVELFNSCGENPVEAIGVRVKTMGDKFCSHYTAPSDKHPGSHDTFARMRLKMGVALYYKLLEAILLKEKKQNKPLGNLLSQDHFHYALFTCCLEVVIFSYNSQRTFPWILDIFQLEPIHFYKVIEIIIRTEDSLPRDVVKHLQRIEEQILESRAWTKQSSLWDAIAKDAAGVPSCEEVSLPGQSVAEPPIHIDPGQSPLSHYKKPFSVARSPMAGDRFKSPVVNAVARRQLAFGDQTSGGNSSHIMPTSPVRNSHMVSPTKTFIKVQGQNLPIAGLRHLCSTVQTAGPSGEESEPARPKRTGSLALFFRKVYHVAHLRLDALCQSLFIIDEDVKRKIWTTFEFTMTRHTDLMKDRHLDQLLMCSLYIVCKVVGQNKNFTDIMKQYRNQPQAASHVYRSVLLGAARLQKKEGSESEKEKSNNPPPTPTRLAATSSIIDGEERGDLIKFYNMVFMERLQEFSLKFKRSRANEAPPLSPLPKLRAHPQSPCRKVSENHSVYIRPLKAQSSDVVTFNPRSPHKPLSYEFSRSPAKNLAAINALMKSEGERKQLSVGKRLLADDSCNSLQQQQQQQMVIIQHGGGSEDEPPQKVQLMGQAVNSKLGFVLGDRSTTLQAD